MLFNSLHFAIFLPIVFFLYWFITPSNLKLQNSLLFVSSYFFYACWDIRFLFLLLFSTLLDYLMGIKIACSDNSKHKFGWLCLSISTNLGILGVFKYYNFFAESLSYSLAIIGINTNFASLKMILPVGISFYTFHGISYLLDIYKNKIKSERNFIDYAVFVSFFPLLVAGPIERATHLLPQIRNKRHFDYLNAVDGLRQILWGLFKKIVIADNCAMYANSVFNNSNDLSGSTLVLGAVFFAIQIYADFSGYSDIALGTARLFGIELLRNFSFPYFSRNIPEFWQRWHISLTSWFKEYLYFPLGGNKEGLWKQIRNTFIVFIVSGFWHGANWTFIIWGFLNAVYMLPSILFPSNSKNTFTVAQGKYFPSLNECIAIGSTFSLTIFAWIFFRATSCTHALNYIAGIFSYSLFSIPSLLPKDKNIFLIPFFFIIEWIGREQKYAIGNLDTKSPLVRWIFYLIIGFFIAILGNYSESTFIYFAF